jgi:hypothetical protein
MSQPVNLLSYLPERGSVPRAPKLNWLAQYYANQDPQTSFDLSTQPYDYFGLQEFGLPSWLDQYYSRGNY